MAASVEETAVFLADFKQKLKIFDIRFRDDRGKNMQALLDLEIAPSLRKSVIEALQTDDYVEGPLSDTLNLGAPLWVFGRLIKNTEIYIKISVGGTNRPAICISFHQAGHPLNYPFK